MSGRYVLGRQKFAEGAISWSTHTIKAVLLSSAYTVNLNTHEFLSDLTGVVSTSAAFTQKTSTGGWADCQDIPFAAVTGALCTQMVVFRDTAVAGTSPLISHHSSGVGMPIYPNGRDILVIINSPGLFRI